MNFFKRKLWLFIIATMFSVLIVSCGEDDPINNDDAIDEDGNVSEIVDLGTIKIVAESEVPEEIPAAGGTYSVKVSFTPEDTAQYISWQVSSSSVDVTVKDSTYIGNDSISLTFWANSNESASDGSLVLSITTLGDYNLSKDLTINYKQLAETRLLQRNIEWAKENLQEGGETLSNGYHVFTLAEALEACPAGWRLPTANEMAILYNSRNGADSVLVNKLGLDKELTQNGNQTAAYWTSSKHAKASSDSFYRNYYYYFAWDEVWGKGLKILDNYNELSSQKNTNKLSVRCVRQATDGGKQATWPAPAIDSTTAKSYTDGYGKPWVKIGLKKYDDVFTYNQYSQVDDPMAENCIVEAYIATEDDETNWVYIGESKASDFFAYATSETFRYEVVAGKVYYMRFIVSNTVTGEFSEPSLPSPALSSEPVEELPQLSSPENFAGTLGNGGKVTFTWDAVADAQTYELYESPTESSAYASKVATFSGTTGSFSRPNNSNVKVYYWIYAKNSNGEYKRSGRSNTIYIWF